MFLEVLYLSMQEEARCIIKVGIAVPSGIRHILITLLQHRVIRRLGKEALGTQYTGDGNRKGKGKFICTSCKHIEQWRYTSIHS